MRQGRHCRAVQPRAHFAVDLLVRHGVARAMIQGTGTSLVRIALVAAAVGALLRWAASMAHGDGARGDGPMPFPLPVDDDCRDFTALPPVPAPSQAMPRPMAPRVSWQSAPALRAIPALWTERRQ